MSSRIVNVDGCGRCPSDGPTRLYGGRRLCSDCVKAVREAQNGPYD